MSEIAYYYLPERNPLGAVLPGVPLADLSTDEIAAFPPHVRVAVSRCRFYQSATARAALAAIGAAPRSSVGLTYLQTGQAPPLTPTEAQAAADQVATELAALPPMTADPPIIALSAVTQDAAQSMTSVIAALESPPADTPPAPSDAPKTARGRAKPAPPPSAAPLIEETPTDG